MALSALDEGGDWRDQGDPRPLNRKQMHSLFYFPNMVPEFRGRQGWRYPLATLLAIAARLAGCRGVTAITEFADRPTHRQLKSLRAYYSRRLDLFTAPTLTPFHKVLSHLSEDTLEQALRQ